MRRYNLGEDYTVMKMVVQWGGRPAGAAFDPLEMYMPAGLEVVTGRGLHSFTLELNLRTCRTHS